MLDDAPPEPATVADLGLAPAAFADRLTGVNPWALRVREPARGRRIVGEAGAVGRESMGGCLDARK